MRLTVSYTPTATGNYRLVAVSSGVTGTIYVDALQLEAEAAASTYNLIEEGSFENTASFSTSSTVFGKNSAKSSFRKNILKSGIKCLFR